jgi:capsular polysaccharide biosynthesis protein
MAEHALWHLKRVTLAIPVPSVAALRARAWMVGPPLLLGLLGAFIATQLQTPTWRGKAEVFIRVPELAAGSATPPTLVSGGPFGDPYSTQYLDAQARLARSPTLAAHVVRVAAIPGLTSGEFLRHSRATVASDADILTLSVTYRRRALAARLANAYASEFVHFKNKLDRRNVEKVLHRIQAKINQLRAHDMTGTPAYENLIQTRQKLEAFSVQLRSASVFRRANSASSFRPHALRNGILGGALGVLLGVALTAGVAARRRRGN